MTREKWFALALVAAGVASVLPGQQAPAAATKEKKAPAGTFDNPKVPAGKVAWHADLATACAAAKKSGKPVLLFHMMGRLDDRFC